MKLFFIVNPVSGGVNKEPFLKAAKSLCHTYHIQYKVFKTTGKNDEETVKKQLSEYKPDKVLSVGGDGTTLFSALALMDSKYPIGIIPLGSANGMATELYVNPQPIEALKDVIMSNIEAGLDILKVNDKYHTAHIGDVGVNAQIVKAYENDSKRGMAIYAKYFLDKLTQVKPFPITVRANNKVYNEMIFMVGICNSRKYGTGIPINIKGNPMDGKFEIVLIKSINANSLIKAGLSKFDESFFDSQSGMVLETEYAEIEFDKPRLLQLDGEIIGKFKELKIEILKGAVNLITTNKNLNFTSLHKNTSK